VLTGSQHCGLRNAIAQSLAGRTAILHLLPPSLGELRRFGDLPDDLFELMRIGSFPRIWDRGLDPGRWLADYTATYVQRDVRQVLEVGDIEAFTTFVRLCAGRTAQEVNLSELGGDAGVSHNTARSWLSVLETSYVVFRLPAFHLNVRKQLIKAPKLHFVDTGLACYLLGIRTADDLRSHPLRGALFETWVAAEIYKQIAHAGSVPRLSHYRETRGAEVDIVVDPGGQRLLAVDAKSGSTVQPSFLRGLRRFVERLGEADDPRDVETRIVYGGDEEQRRSDARVVPWAGITGVDWT
jgi:predicted AAA+ superfamily ATPase